MEFKYNFHDMKSWYEANISDTRIFETDATVHAWEFTLQNDWKKYNKKEELDYFLLERVRKIRKLKELSDTYYEKYPFGIYIVIDYHPDWVLIVTPKKKRNDNGIESKYLYGDHYSLPFNKEAKSKQIQFHESMYIPRSDDGYNGICAHVKSHFNNNITLPIQGDTTSILQKIFSPVERMCVLDIMRMYKVQEGAGKRKAATPVREPTKKARVATPVQPKVLNNYLSNKIQHIFAFAIKYNDKYCVTCSVFDSKRRSKDETRLGFFFVLDKLDSAAVKRHIFDYIADLE